MIHIEKVNEKSFKKILDMELCQEQGRFVAPNVVSLAQAWLYYDHARPFAIYNDDEVVGFVMLDWDEDERSVGIWRFMIATEHQHKGYGAEAMKIIIEMVAKQDKFDFIYLDYVQGNTVARQLYYKLGFRENGKVEDDEVIMILKLTDKPKACILTADEDDIDDIITLIEMDKQKNEIIPDALLNQEKLKKAIVNQQIKRFALYGETIGIHFGGVTYVGSQYKSLCEEIDSLMGWKKN